MEENLDLLERGRIELPPGTDIGTFLVSDGKQTGKPFPVPPPPRPLTLGELRDAYLAVHSNGAMEANSLETMRLHLRHVARTLGESIPIETLGTSQLQKHIDRRSRKRYRGRLLSPITLRKEWPACGLAGTGARSPPD
jgi:hypothetical protein